jgi:hypothetical protein
MATGLRLSKRGRSRSKSKRGRSKSSRKISTVGKTVPQLKTMVQRRCSSKRVTHGASSKKAGQAYTRGELIGKYHTCKPAGKRSKSKRGRSKSKRGRSKSRRGRSKSRRGRSKSKRSRSRARRNKSKCAKHTSTKGPLRCRSVDALKKYIRKRCRSKSVKLGGNRASILRRARSCRKSRSKSR